jgi:hypothetical protein
MESMSMMIAFAPLFSQRVWPQALTLVMGALLAPGKRTVSQMLRVMGLADDPQFQRYHRVLNRAVWSSRQASRILFNRHSAGETGFLRNSISEILVRQSFQSLSASFK